MDENQAKMRMEKDGWTVVEDAGRGWRRVVPCQFPCESSKQMQLMP